jgi:hypothetical protein
MGVAGIFPDDCAVAGGNHAAARAGAISPSTRFVIVPQSFLAHGGRARRLAQQMIHVFSPE